MHGDTVGLVNTLAQDRMSVAFDPWGELLGQTGTETTWFSFQSDPTDPDTALVDMGARWYLPHAASLVTADPANGSVGVPRSLNRFSYGLGAPLSFVDPNGMSVRAIRHDGAQSCLADPGCLGQLDLDEAPPARDCGFAGSSCFASAAKAAAGTVRSAVSRAGKAIVRNTWAAIRDARNRDLTNMALAVAKAQGADCRSREQRLWVCGNASCDGPQDGVTVGNVYVTEDSTESVLSNPALLAHEAKHSDQWAILGSAFVPIYLETEGVARLAGHECGVLEKLAGEEGGGYNDCYGSFLPPPAKLPPHLYRPP